MRNIIYELGQVALKTIWIAIFIVVGLGLLRLMAWSDTDMHGDGSQIETTILP